MKVRMALFFLMAIFCGYNAYSRSPVSPFSVVSSDTLPKIIIINSFDAMSAEGRKNKRELFSELCDSLKIYLAQKIKEKTGTEAIIIPGIKTNISDSSIFSLIKENRAARAIVILSLDTYFSETGEKRVEEYGSDPKIRTSYDLCAANEYVIYDSSRKFNETKIVECRDFTSRSIKDKHFVIKFGPDIVGKKKYTYGIVEKNAEEFLIRNTDLLNN